MKQRLTNGLMFLTLVAVWFCVVFTLLRIYEFALIGEIDNVTKLESLGFLYDWPFACSIALAVTIICLAIAALHVTTAKIVSAITYSLILIASVFIIQYFSVTHVPLSVDLFGYSLDDIKTTVQSSGGVDVAGIFFLVLYVAVFVAGFNVVPKILTKHISLKIAAVILTAFALISLLPTQGEETNFQSEVQFHLVVNKPKYFLDRSVVYFRESSASEESIRKNTNYPFYHTVNYRDVLGKNFAFQKEKPNLVFLFVEGLGADFVGAEAMYGGFTPFLDSLSQKSLYWKNAMSNAGRTFGVLPSALGSLPYGKDGFLSYGIEMPDHQTLMSLMKKNGYAANYFYGGNPNFDNQDLFLQYQGVDFFLNESNFPLSYTKAAVNGEGFSWGYSDADVFSYSLEVLSERKASPRMDVYLTLTTHEPFISPDAKFDDVVDETLKGNKLAANVKDVVSEYRGVFSCLLYTDNAIRNFFAKYRQQPEFQNTIFVITGDHRLIPVPQDSKISRFRVPLIMYSPMLKEPKTFGSIVTHSDLPEALLGMLSKNFEFQIPSAMPIISEQLDTLREFSSNADVALMRNKGDVNDYLFGKYFLSDNLLYAIDPQMNLTRIENDSLRNTLAAKLKSFKLNSIVACGSNHVDKTGSGRKFKSFTLSKEDEEFLEDESLTNAIPDVLFKRAQRSAFETKYKESNIILRHLLNKTPNYHDARLLLGRTFAWQSQYDTAKVFFQEVLTRSPAYEDAFAAFSDIEYWQNDVEKSLEYAERGLKANPNNPDLLAQKARGILAAGEKQEAQKITEQVLKRMPTHELALEINLKSKQ